MSRSFQTTRWTLVLRASSGNQQQREAALAELLNQNWYPLYAYLRHTGKPAAEAEDLVQSFFLRVLERDLFNSVDPSRQGRFRNFLLVCLKRFVSGERRHDQALKRGGGTRTLSIDAADAERRYQLEPVNDQTADIAFERAWAVELIARSLKTLEQQWEAAGDGPQFQLLKGCLTTGAGGDRGAIAEQLGISRESLRVRIHRLRAEFRQVLCSEVAETLGRDDLLEDEINLLFLALSR